MQTNANTTPELLAPAGSMESLKAAIANGCDAVYVGMQRFGARAYSSNFDEDQMAEALEYAHLRGVKVYATVNTIVFEDELDDAFSQLDFLNSIGVDGVIVCDLAVMDYVTSHFEDMPAHCSTQMGVDDVEGALLCKELGAKRVVVAREMELDGIKRIREQAGIPVEAFCHGAICIAYSGNCLMSSMIGDRSGNRGRCVGSCRKVYKLVDAETGETLSDNYLLSAKDLCTIDCASQFDGIDSMKIEGRMREPIYVCNAVAAYRNALDGNGSHNNSQRLERTFNRSYTDGYILGADPGDITNVDRPNNHGYAIGKVASMKRGMYEIELDKPLAQNDIIRIRHGNEDVEAPVVKLYDKNGMLINGADKVCYIKLKEKLSAGDIVYKIKDTQFIHELESHLDGEFKRFALDVDVKAIPGSPLAIEARGLGVQCTYVGDEPVSEAINRATTREDVIKQFERLGNTVFCLGDVRFDGENAFVPAKMLNAARREIVEALYEKKLESKQRRTHEAAACEPITFEAQEPMLCAQVQTQDQYEACLSAGLSAIYFENVVKRNNNASYEDMEGELLVGGLGGIFRYRESNPIVADYSLNAANSKTCYELHRLGAKRVTLSYEMSKGQIRNLIDGYKRDNGGLPSLEMVVYGHTPLMVSKHCPLKKLGQCGKCRGKRYEMDDGLAQFTLKTNDDCTVTIYNGKTLNLLDEIANLDGIAAFRLNFTTEGADEVERIIKLAQGKLDGSITEPAFNPSTDTRGHFNKRIL